MNQGQYQALLGEIRRTNEHLGQIVSLLARLTAVHEAARRDAEVQRAPATKAKPKKGQTEVSDANHQ